MIRLGAKLVAFLICYEFAVCFGINGGIAFMLALAIACGWFPFLQLLGEAMQIVGPGVVRIALQFTLWIGLTWFCAPAWLNGLALDSEAGLFLLLAVIGGCLHRRAADGKTARKDRSLPIVLAVIGIVASCGSALYAWGSLWPLVGYAMLVVLPVGIGWQLVPIAARRNADAQFGDAEAFARAGYSRER